MDDPNKLLDYIIEHTNQRFDEMRERLDKVDSKIEILVAFRWQLLGAASLVSVLIGIIIQLLSVFSGRT